MQPALNLEELRLAIVSHLPVQSRWLLRETPLDWNFSRATQLLRPLPEEDAERWAKVLPPDWRQMLIFGEQDIAEGGGASPFLCVHAQTGQVFGLDVEREQSAAFLLNSTVPAFVNTFLLIDSALRAGDRLPSDMRDRIRAADPGVFEESDWKEMVDYLDELTKDGA
jgi:hypothetical protein